MDPVLAARRTRGLHPGAASRPHPGAAIRAIYTCGGGARIPGLTEQLGSRLRIEAQLANPLATLTMADGAMDGLSADQIAPLLMLPIGLALRVL